MGLIVRVDVDNPYPRNTKMGLVANYLKLNLYFPKLKFLGYLTHLERLIDYLTSLGVSATLFLRVEALPKNLKFDRRAYEVALHAVNTRNYSSFLREVNVLKREFGEIIGFSKHGSGELKLSRRHYAPYEPHKYIRWGIKCGLKYFSGNDQDFTKTYLLQNDFVYFPSAFWLKSTLTERESSVKRLLEYSEDNDAVVLVHPINWYLYENLRRNLDYILSRANEILSFREFLKKKIKVKLE